MAGFVGPVIANESNDVDRVAPVEPCMRVDSDDPVCSLFNDLLYFVRHHNKVLQMQKNVIERLCEVTQAQHAALLDVKKLVMDMHNDVFLRRENQEVLTASRDQTAKIWSASTGQCKQILTGLSGSVRSAVFSTDGSEVLTASND